MGDVDRVDEIIKSYISESEWLELADAVRDRHRQMYLNYLELAKILPDAKGFMPDFMKPDFNASKQKHVKPKKTKKTLENKENHKPRVKKSTVATRKNPRRNVPAVNYTEQEVPQDDRYVYCDDCKEDCIDHCIKCGDLKHLKDHRVPMGRENRAKLTVPKGILEIKPSKKHGLGVFALKHLPKGIKLGPYEGKLLKKPSESSYAWKVRGYGLIDGADDRNSNWMRYINCANHTKEQNLIAFQYLGNIYYRTSEEINIGDELLVYYGNSFAKELGLDVERYYKPVSENLEKYVYCKFCCFGFLNSAHLHRHMARCENNPAMKEKELREGKFNCRYCKVTISDEEYFAIHEKYCREKWKCGEAVEEKKYKCDKCKYQTNISSSLQRHQHVHKEDFKFFCAKCDYKTNQKSDMKTHVNAKHTKERVYQCTKCSYFCYVNSNLTSHIKYIHLNLRTFVCNICKKRFNTNCELNKHIMYKHLGKQKMKCEFCDYVSENVSNIKKHINAIHTKKQLLQCKKCTYVTPNANTLKRHVFTHETEKPFKCSLCTYQSIRPQHLRNHIKNKHS